MEIHGKEGSIPVIIKVIVPTSLEVGFSSSYRSTHNKPIKV
jgi:hypothetical protein